MMPQPTIFVASKDWTKLRAAQDAVDRLPEGTDKDALTFAVLQWFHASFLFHGPLSPKETAWAKKVLARLNSNVVEV